MVTNSWSHEKVALLGTIGYQFMTKSMTVRPRINRYAYDDARDYYKSEYGRYPKDFSMPIMILLHEYQKQKEQIARLKDLLKEKSDPDDIDNSTF